ncbi:uncharacterized protein Z520_10072 [Fonsecaea multimorphosa CBS 102226]|uniref:Uncharacterized protein n=1 Tax=Fonsecaea multimorphosa CBS 102226 TaxID=1442371 RepID=A0A0D2JM22_9EURO|nr:uncharacterized protein Z520_10072 [Fonsecaea multimorphosa CBS 102226]KIX94362.1 hypothetical protein Z520_10072 [Fonsecaea multimorphosa CBS 102226]
MTADSQGTTAQIGHPGTEPQQQVGGPHHKETVPKEEATLEEQELNERHKILSWTVYYVDDYLIHYSEKAGSG